MDGKLLVGVVHLEGGTNLSIGREGGSALVMVELDEVGELIEALADATLRQCAHVLGVPWEPTTQADLDALVRRLTI